VLRAVNTIAYYSLGVAVWLRHVPADPSERIKRLPVVDRLLTRLMRLCAAGVGRVAADAAQATPISVLQADLRMYPWVVPGSALTVSGLVAKNRSQAFLTPGVPLHE